MTQNRAFFRQFKDSVGSIDRQSRGIAGPVAGIGIQQKVVDVEDASRPQNPENLPAQKILIRIIGDAGQDGAEQHRVEMRVGEINGPVLLKLQRQFRMEAPAALKERFREINSAETGVSQSEKLRQDSSVSAADVQDFGLPVRHMTSEEIGAQRRRELLCFGGIVPEALGILHDRLFSQSADFDSGFDEDFARGAVDGVALLVDDFADAGVDDHFRTEQTRTVRGVERGVLDGDSVIGRLHDGILLSMRAETLRQSGSGRGLRGAAGTTSLAAVSDSPRRSVVSGGDDALVLHDHGGHMTAGAVAPERHDVGDLHEILIPVGAFVFLCSVHIRHSLLKKIHLRDSPVFILFRGFRANRFGGFRLCSAGERDHRLAGDN